MLVLSRQLDESIVIGDDIVITVVDIRGNKIRLGIAAPPNVPVHRQEVFEAIQRENMEAVHQAANVPSIGKPATVKPKTLEPKAANSK